MLTKHFKCKIVFDLKERKNARRRYIHRGYKIKRSRPISRVLSWTVIHLGQVSPRASSNLPESSAGRAIGFLFGLAPNGVYRAANCYQLRGALLPHPFTLTIRRWRSTLCCTFRRLAPPRRYLAFCPMEPGLSSLTCARATVWPPPCGTLQSFLRDHKRHSDRWASAHSYKRFFLSPAIVAASPAACFSGSWASRSSCITRRASSLGPSCSRTSL